MDIRDFGGAGDGTTDNVAAWNAAMAALPASPTDRLLHFPAGLFVFNSQPNPVTCAARIEGEGHVATKLMRGGNFNGTLIKWTGGAEVYGGTQGAPGGGAGGMLKHLSLDAGQTSGGSAVWIQSQPETNPNIGSRNPHGVLIEDVYAVGGYYYPNAGNWGIGFYLDGSLNANPPAGVAAGIRACRLHWCGASQFYLYPFLFDTAHGTRFMALDAYVPIGNAQCSVTINSNSLNCWGVNTGSCPTVFIN